MVKKNELYKIAVATTDGIVINTHYGRATEFQIYAILEDDTVSYIEKREVEAICNSGTHDEEKLINNAKKLIDCKYILVSKIGDGAANALLKEGISAVELPGIIEESIKKLITYDKIQSLFA